jgi:hypothetical protein
MREADRIAAAERRRKADRIAAAERRRKDAEARQAEAALRDEYRALAQRLKQAVPTALAVEERRNYRSVVEVHGTVRSWFRDTYKHFGAFELFTFKDDVRKRQLTVYLTTGGDIAYSDDESYRRVTVCTVAEYLTKVRTELDEHAAHLKTSPVFNAKTEQEHAQHAAWVRTSPRHKPWVPEAALWKVTGLRKVVEALERMGGLRRETPRA